MHGNIVHTTTPVHYRLLGSHGGIMLASFSSAPRNSHGSHETCARSHEKWSAPVMKAAVSFPGYWYIWDFSTGTREIIYMKKMWSCHVGNEIICACLMLCAKVASESDWPGNEARWLTGEIDNAKLTHVNSPGNLRKSFGCVLLLPQWKMMYCFNA